MEGRITRSGRVYCTPTSKHINKIHETQLKEKSARKKLVLLDPPNELSVSSLTDELILEEIKQLSPLSSIRRCKENVDPKPTNCYSLSSPLRSLNLNSPLSKKCDVVLQNCINVALKKKSPDHVKEVIKSPRKRVLSEAKTIHQTLLEKSSFVSNNLRLSPRKHSPSKLIDILSPSPSKRNRSVEASPVSLKVGKENVINATAIEDELLCQSKKWKRLFSSEQFAEGNILNDVKTALHTSIPLQLVGRDSEIDDITSFIEECVTSHTSGSLYISGAPGTGKTACLTNVLSSEKISHIIPKQIIINCMALRTSQKIYERIAIEMGATRSESKNHRLALKYVEEHLIKDGPMILLFLDEMDQLDSKHQEVLYTMFGWSSLRNSKIVLIGIANSLDLTDRILPRLQANVTCKPQLLNFKPYNKDQLIAILQARVRQTSVNKDEKHAIIDPVAMQFCARKVAAMSGDARKALDVCRRAVEILEVNSVKNSENSYTKDAPLGSRKVDIKQISNVIADVYQSSSICNHDGNGDHQDTFPLQQKLLVCALILLCKKMKYKEAALGKLHEAYAKICKKRLVPSVCQSEFVSLCDLVEARGVISVKKLKEVRQSKIKLNIQENDAEFAFQGKALLDSVLLSGL